jgi:hypothetical protein
MNVIKNRRLIESLLSEDQLDRLELGAAMHKRHSRIHFKVVEVGENHVRVQTEQTKSPAKNYFLVEELEERTKSLFGGFFPDKEIRVFANEYVSPTVDDVTPTWLQRKMRDKGINQSAIVKATGIDKTNISAWLSGSRPMTQPVKAMFYYMFK